MSIFSWLFKRPKAVNVEADPGFPKGRRSTLQVSRDKHFLTVESLDFYGLYQLSKSKHWAIGWRDSDPAAGRGGHRDVGPWSLSTGGSEQRYSQLQRKHG